MTPEQLKARGRAISKGLLKHYDDPLNHALMMARRAKPGARSGSREAYNAYFREYRRRRKTTTEPDWPKVYADHLARARNPKIPIQLQEETAYEATLKDWRRHFATPMEDGRKMPAPAVDGIIALANLKVFAPISLQQHVPRKV